MELEEIPTSLTIMVASRRPWLLLRELERVTNLWVSSELIIKLREVHHLNPSETTLTILMTKVGIMITSCTVKILFPIESRLWSKLSLVRLKKSSLGSLVNPNLRNRNRLKGSSTSRRCQLPSSLQSRPNLERRRTPTRSCQIFHRVWPPRTQPLREDTIPLWKRRSSTLKNLRWQFPKER